MKRFILVMMFVLVLVIPAMALDFGWSANYGMVDSSGVMFKADADNDPAFTGLSVCCLLELKTETSRLIGIGGAMIGMKSENEAISSIFGATLFTFFDDLVQVGITASPSDFQINNPDSYIPYISMSLMKFGGRIKE
mgnify:CR=1 FL=1